MLDQDCSVCRRVDSVRRGWGCDSEAPTPFAYLECWRCLGYDPECEVCKGDQRGVPMVDCPFRILPQSISKVVPLFGDFRNGLLPAPGGLLDQAGTFVQAARYIGGCLSRIEEAQRQQQQSKTDTIPADIRAELGRKNG